MSNETEVERLAVLVCNGESNQMDALWESVERLARYWSKKIADKLCRYGTVNDAEEAFQDLYFGCAYIAFRFAVDRYKSTERTIDFVSFFRYCLKAEAAKLYGYRSSRRDALQYACSIYEQIGNADESMCIIDTLIDDHNGIEDFEEQEYRKVLYRVLHDAIEELPPHYAEIVKARFFDGRTLEDIAKERGVTKQRIDSIIRKSRRMLRKNDELQRTYCVDYYMSGLKGISYKTYINSGERSTEISALMIIGRKEGWGTTLEEG